MSISRQPLPSPGERLLIGWKEYVDFPDWDLRRIKVKIDTGARSSALDVARYELVEEEDGCFMADLYLGLSRAEPRELQVLRVPVLKMVVVRSSTGVREQRPLIETTVRLGPIRKVVRLTVADRSSMRFRMILGRTALDGHFVVDVSQKYLMKKRRR